MNRMKAIYPIAYVCVAILILAGSTQNPRRELAGPQAFPGQNRAALQQQRAGEPVSENEWQDVVNWMQVHCPNQMDFYLHRLENRPLQQAAVKKRIVELYRQINTVRDDYLLKPALILHAESQDKVFGASIEFREAWQQRDHRNLPQAQQHLQEATEQLIDSEIGVRKARVQKLQNELEDMIKRKSQLVKARFDQQLKLARNPGPGPRGSGDADINPPSDADKH